MSQDNENTEAPPRRRPQQASSRSFFSIPAPVKQLFDRFPLVTYPINHLPQRAPHHRDTPVLHLFTTNEGALKGAPSYNPACLKWQVRMNKSVWVAYQADVFSRHTSSFPTSTSASLRPVTTHLRAARFRFSFPHSQTPSSLCSQCRRASYNDGP